MNITHYPGKENQKLPKENGNDNKHYNSEHRDPERRKDNPPTDVENRHGLEAESGESP